jgi:hypothetical protein
MLRSNVSPGFQKTGWLADLRPESSANAGGQGQNRTADTVIFSHVLYQLSYLASLTWDQPLSIAFA